METPDTSIRRAARTYGRRKIPEVPDVDATFAAESSASSNRSSPTFSESSREVPPSSDFETSFNHGDDDADDDTDIRVDLNRRFDWKKKMQEMEMGFEEEMGDVAVPHKTLSSESDEGRSSGDGPRRTHGIGADDEARSDDDTDSSSIQPFYRRSIKDALAQIDMEFDSASQQARDKPSLSSGNVTLGDRLGGPSTRPVEETKSIHARRSPREKSPSSSPSSRVRRVAKRRTVLPSSDSEGERPALRNSSPQTPPDALHHIGTPKIASSPTPPTTQEMESKGKGKGKAPSKTQDDAESDELPVLKVTKKSRSKGKDKEKRVKAPTRKERLETEKTTARIKAEQEVVLERSHVKYNPTKFWGQVMLPRNTPEPAADGPSSDPIQPFSSPVRPQPLSVRPRQTSSRPPLAPRARSSTIQPLNLLASSSRPERPSSRRASGSATRDHQPEEDGNTFVATGLLDELPARAAESSDEDMEIPDVGTLLKEDRKKRAEAEAKKKAWELKMKALTEKKLVADVDDDSDLEIVDNDMHVVANEEEKDRRAAKAKHLRPSIGRKNQLALAGRSTIRSPTKSSPLRSRGRDLHALAAAAAPHFGIDARAETRKGKERASGKLTADDLNRTLLYESGKQSRELTLQKEREFYRNRDLPSENRPDESELREAKQLRLREIVERGILVAEKKERAREEDYGEEESEGSDQDWVPAEEGVGSAEENEEPMAEGDGNDENVPPPREAALTTEDEDEENVRPAPRRPTAKHLQVIDSDEENDENRPPPSQPFGRVLVEDSSLVLDDDQVRIPNLSHRPSMSSLEGGTDKENDEPVVPPAAADEENVSVPTPFTLSSVRAPLRRSESAFTLSGSSQPRIAEREPFKELPVEEDEAELSLDSPTRPPVGLGMRPATPETPTRSGPRDLSPLLLRSSSGAGVGNALGAFFEPTLPAAREGTVTPVGPSSLQPAADIALGGGLGEFWSPSAKGSRSETPQAPKNLMADMFFASAKATPVLRTARAAGKARASDELDLTLGSVAQPSLQVNQSLVRKADAIFEKDQGQLVEAAIAENKPAESPMFIGPHGFLTQTAHFLQTQAAGTQLSPSTLLTSPMFNESAPNTVARQPLSVRRLPSPDEESPSRLKRLRKRPTDNDDDVFGPVGGYRSSPSPSPVKRTAFDVLGKGKKIAALQLPKKKLGKSMFVEGEAEESDEDAGFGFGLVRKKDDEEELDGEEQDQVLEELVDDAQMDENTLNEEKVLEKVQEHRALDDAADEKIARDAIEGKLRMKRRNGQIDFEDEDSDEEDYDAKRRRQRMAKKRRIDGDSLEKLANNPETQAFVEAYRAEMEDDNEEFAHLEQEDENLMIETTPDREREDEDEDEEEPREVVSAMDLQAELRRVARGEQVVETIDTNDVTWVDADEDDDMDQSVRIKEVVTKPKRSVPRNPSEMEWEILQPRREDSAGDMARNQKWARSEGGSRNAGTGRASAVTGHGKSAKVGGGSLNGRRSEQAREKPGAKPLAKAPSALSAVSGRRARFG